MQKYYYTYLVYLTNKESSLYNHIYYGKHETRNILDGYKGSGKILGAYLRKYPNDYYFKIIKLYNSREELNKAEYELIKPHLGKDYCINLKRGGEGGCSYIISQETRDKISQQVKERWKDTEYRKSALKKLNEYIKDHPEYKIKLSNVQKGHKVTDETRKKIGDAHRGRTLTAEHRYKCGNANRGKKDSDELRKKKSEARKKYLIEHPEAIYKCGNANRGKPGVNLGKHRVYDINSNKYHLEY